MIENSFGIVIFNIIWMLLFIASSWKTFEKAGQKGWYCAVPFFNVYIVFERILCISWLNVFKLLIPFYNIYYGIVLIKKWSEAFGKTTSFVIGLIFLPFIFYPVLAFGNSRYINTKRNDTVKKCNNCGEIINSNVKFCDKCGNKIDVENTKKVEEDIKEENNRRIIGNPTFDKFRYLTLDEYLNSKEYSSLGFKHKLLFKKIIKKDFNNRGILEEIFFNKDSVLSKLYYEKDSKEQENAHFLFTILKVAKNKDTLSFLVSNPDEMKWFNNLGKGMQTFVDYLESTEWNYPLAKQQFVTMKSELRNIMIGTWILFLILYWLAPTSESVESFRKLKGQWALNGIAFTIMFIATECTALKIYIKSKSKIKVSIVMSVFILTSCSVTSLFFIIEKVSDIRQKNSTIEKVEEYKEENTVQTNKKIEEILDETDSVIEKYPNGNTKKIETRQPENGMLTEKIIDYYEDGNIKSEQIYKYFKLQGLEEYESVHNSGSYKEYYTNKKLKTFSEEKATEDGRYKYSSVTYFEDGKIMKKVTGEYLESTGKNLNYKDITYSSDGNIISEDVLNNKESDVATFREYYDNGKIKLEKKYTRDSSGEEKVISLVNYDNAEELKSENKESVIDSMQQSKLIESVANDIPKEKTKEVSQVKPKEKKKVPQCKNYYKGSERDQMILINNERKYVDNNGCIL